MSIHELLQENETKCPDCNQSVIHEDYNGLYCPNCGWSDYIKSI